MNKYLKFLAVLFLGINFSSHAQNFFDAEARGLFMSVSTGGRFPISDFSDNHTFGIGLDVTFSYTDNRVLPLFFYTKIGYAHFPGESEFYLNSSYSTIASNIVNVQPGVRFFYEPIIKNVVVLMPILEVGLSMTYFTTLNQFKPGTGLQNYYDENTKFGFHIGAGVSMFLIDVMAYYNYLPENQYISLDFRIRIPIFATVK